VKALCLAIGLIVAVVGGLEQIALVAAHWAARLAPADDLDDLLDLDLDLELDFDLDIDVDSDKLTQPLGGSDSDGR
jgi:hypothetical protein